MESAVLISIKPEWCEKILNGKKTVEIRKTFPHDHMPFKCYIYCTKNLKSQHILEYNGCYDAELAYACGKVIGEFVCDRFHFLSNVATDSWDGLYGDAHVYEKQLVLNKARLTEKQIHEYANGKGVYAWYISNLKIYDKPKELCEFTKYNKDCYFAGLPMARPESCSNCDMCRVTRAPQSWMYVEELEDER